MAVTYNEIAKRFRERVIPNGWHTAKDGAEQYLKKYGRNIGFEKLILFHMYSLDNGHKNFANGLMPYINEKKLEWYNSFKEATYKDVLYFRCPRDIECTVCPLHRIDMIDTASNAVWCTGAWPMTHRVVAHIKQQLIKPKINLWKKLLEE